MGGTILYSKNDPVTKEGSEIPSLLLYVFLLHAVGMPHCLLESSIIFLRRQSWSRATGVVHRFPSPFASDPPSEQTNPSGLFVAVRASDGCQTGTAAPPCVDEHRSRRRGPAIIKPHPRHSGAGGTALRGRHSATDRHRPSRNHRSVTLLKRHGRIVPDTRRPRANGAGTAGGGAGGPSRFEYS